jgi:hypothetical protein
MNKNNLLLIVLAVLILGGGFWYVKSKNATTMTGGEEGLMVEEDAMTGEDAMEGGDVAKLESVMNVALIEQAESTMKQTGTALIEEKDGQVVVTLSVEPAGSVVQPAHIHMGTCPLPGEVVYPLIGLVDGKSVTNLNVTMAALKEQMPLAINVHKSADEAAVYTACGDLK